MGPDALKPPKPQKYSSDLKTTLDSLRYALDLPSLAGAIVTDTGIIDAQAVGCRRYGGEMNITLDDQYNLGSNTKAITAVLIGILIDEGYLSWSTTLPEVFPEDTQIMRPEYRDVTILNLLSHSSGFMRIPTPLFSSGTPRDQRAEMVKWALAQPPAIERGKYLYSNLGYNILGAIAEKLADRPFEEMLKEKVLNPLGITSAGFGPMGSPGQEDEPLQHTNARSPIEPLPNADLPPVYSPSARLHLSIRDWARFIQWMLAAQSGHQSLVTQHTAGVLTTKQVQGDSGSFYYACGWMVYSSQWAGGTTLSHSGSNGYNYSEAILAPGKCFGVLAMTNMGPGDMADPLSPVTAKLIHLYQTRK